MGLSDKTGQTEIVKFADENKVNIQALRFSPRRSDVQSLREKGDTGLMTLGLPYAKAYASAMSMLGQLDGK